jgi:hypothetical protein
MSIQELSFLLHLAIDHLMQNAMPRSAASENRFRKHFFSLAKTPCPLLVWAKTFTVLEVTTGTLGMAMSDYRES